MEENASRLIAAVPLTDERTGQFGILESLDVTDQPAVDRDLADVQEVIAFGSPYAKLWAYPFFGVPQRIDGEIGIGSGAVDNDTDPSARHGVGPNRADRLRITRRLRTTRRRRGGRDELAACRGLPRCWLPRCWMYTTA